MKSSNKKYGKGSLDKIQQQYCKQNTKENYSMSRYFDHNITVISLFGCDVMQLPNIKDNKWVLPQSFHNQKIHLKMYSI